MACRWGSLTTRIQLKRLSGQRSVQYTSDPFRITNISEKLLCDIWQVHF